MMNNEILKRLDFIEFRQQLLFDNDAFSRLLFEHEVTKEQLNSILDLFDSLRDQVDNGQKISSVSYETSIYRLVPHKEHNYHFAEDIAQTLHEAGRYEEVFEALYGHASKFQTYLQNRSR